MINADCQIRIAKVLPVKLLKLIYISLIRSRLEYGSAIVQSAAVTHRNKLETCQKIASRIILGAANDAHAQPLLDSLGLPSLENRRLSHIRGICKSILAEECHPALADVLASSTDHSLLIPSHRTMAGHRRFSATASRIYNA